MKPNFKDINIKSAQKVAMSAPEWEKENHIAKNWTTPELIPVKPVYTTEDLKGNIWIMYRVSLLICVGRILPCIR